MKRDRYNSIGIYPNGVSGRLHNRSAKIFDVEGGIFIELAVFDKDKAHLPAIRHRCLRGKVRVSTMKITKESAELLIKMLIEHLNRDEQTQTFIYNPE